MIFANTILFVVATLAATVSRTTTQSAMTLSYSELVSLNVSCSPKDTCIRELSKSRDLASLNDRNCACDSACLTYGDCCIDAPSKTSRPVPSPAVRRWVCRNLTQFGGIIMKNSCPANWTGGPEVRQMCEAQDDVAHGADPFSVMPVTNRLTGTTYVNYHCAFCNSDTANTLIWMPRLEFDNLDPYNRTYQNITGDYIRDNLEYLEKEKSWGVRLLGNDGQLYGYPAKLFPVIPKEVEELVRPCRKSLISTCAANWFDRTVEEKCSAYEAAVYLHDLTTNTGFRNPHCAICNYVEPWKLVCKPPAPKADVEQRTFNFQSFSLLVDFNNANGGQVGEKQLCFEGETYDPFQKKCRNLVCGFPGYVLINGKCVLQKPSTTTTASTTSTTTTTTALPTTTTTTTSPTTTTSTTTAAATTTTTTPDPTTIPTTTTVAVSSFSTNQGNATTSSNVPPVPTTTPFTTTLLDVDPNLHVTSTEVTGVEETTVLLSGPLKYDTFTTEDNSVNVVTLSRNETALTTESTRREEKSDSKSANMREVTSYPPTTTAGSSYSQDFIECPKFPVQPENVDVFPNGTIYVIPYDRYYAPFNYLFSGNQILVCAFFINDTRTEVQKFSPALGYVTLVGLSISMFCLLLHFVVFLLVPDLQNLSTRNLSSFALALFFAHFCFTIGCISTISKLACTTLAVTTFYFFLVSFFWMNTMSYDVWRTLRLATQELRVSSGKQWKRFILYSAYSWGVPSAIVSVALVVDNVGGVPDEFRPRFGAKYCWFNERTALLVFFGSPLILIVIANIICFVSSAKMILSTSHSTSNNYSASSKRNFKLYLRLGIMMGLTWTFGTIAGYLDLETLWYIFVILNTLQGLFIFVAFTCNRKVRKYLADKFQSIRNGRQAYRTSSLNSGSGFNSNSTFPSSNTSGSKTMTSQLNETKSTLMSPEKSMSALTSPPNRSLTSFKHLQAGMETLY